MQQSGIKPDRFVAVAVLKACAGSTALTQGKLVHAHTIECSFDMDAFVGSTLVDMYAKCGCLKDAHLVFYSLANRDVVTWNAMILAYAEHGQHENAFQLLEEMRQDGYKPDDATLISLLKACSSLPALNYGKLIHMKIMESGLEVDTCINNTLISMYAKCGGLEDAQMMFNEVSSRTLVTWSAMIAGYAQNGYEHNAFRLFEEMQDKGMEPNHVTYVSVLKACSSILALNLGMLVHAHMICNLIELDVFIGNTLIDMYSKCGSLDEAYWVFNCMSGGNLVTWNAIIGGCINSMSFEEAVRLFYRLQCEGNKPNNLTYTSVLKACSGLAALDQGKLIHSHILESGFELDEFMGSALIEMYAKCGSLEEAARVFMSSSLKGSVLLWCVMIEGYVLHSDCKSALGYFKDMQGEGLKPDAVTFISLLSACSHAGLMHEAHCLFNMMIESYGITPIVEHYTCLVNVLGRVGLLDNAEDMLQSMPVMPDTVGWMSLLTNCQTYGEKELGRHCFDNAVIMDKRFTSQYKLASNIYGDGG